MQRSTEGRGTQPACLETVSTQRQLRSFGVEGCEIIPVSRAFAYTAGNVGFSCRNEGVESLYACIEVIHAGGQAVLTRDMAAASGKPSREKNSARRPGTPRSTSPKPYAAPDTQSRICGLARGVSIDEVIQRFIRDTYALGAFFGRKGWVHYGLIYEGTDVLLNRAAERFGINLKCGCGLLKRDTGLPYAGV